MEKYSEDGKILIKGPDNVRFYTVREGTEQIFEDTFRDNEYIEEVKIPEGVCKIMNNAFSNCIFLKKIEIPNSVDEIDKYAFKDCVNITHLKFGDDLYRLGEGCFKGCKSLLEVDFSNTPATWEVTYDLVDEKKTVQVTGIQSIPDYCFANCSNLETINLPSTIKRIGKRAFYGCENLINFNFKGRFQAYKNTFEGCSKLTGLKLIDL